MNIDKMLEKIGEKDEELRNLKASQEAEISALMKKAEKLATEVLIPFTEVIKELSSKGMLYTHQLNALGDRYSGLKYDKETFPYEYEEVEFHWSNIDGYVYTDTKLGCYDILNHCIELNVGGGIERRTQALKHLIETLEQIQDNFEDDLYNYLNIIDKRL